MQLWTDYEGVVLDGAYPLQKLLVPEGRSAFYSTAGPNGDRTVVRLIECHFDEEEILARWRSVQALNHPNFLRLEHFGQTEIDGRPVVYAVFEKVDANLAEVLDCGTLSAEDVAQLGLSLVAALEVLHTHGFVHEHIEPRNIFALNDTVKLRSDCIREAPEGEEGLAAKQRDVRDLANVLLRGLTLRDSLVGIADSPVTKPFGQVIRNGLDGTWGLESIRVALEGLSRSKQPTAVELGNTAPSPGAAQQKPSVEPTKTAASQEAQLPLPLHREQSAASSLHLNTRRERAAEKETSARNSKRLAISGVIAVLVVLLVWMISRSRGTSPRDVSQAQATTASPSPALVPAQPVRESPATSATPVAGNSAPRTASSATVNGPAWRVIAFTYNRRADAEKKVASLTQSHPDLNPEVFTRSGRSPYLVSIGGVMDQRTATALAQRVRGLGLPRDVYAQNYSR